MRCVFGKAVGLLLLIGLVWCPVATADSLFMIENPEVDFQVLDVDDGSGEFFYDGTGDYGPYATFGDVALGSFGAARSMAEFDISGFTIPAGEIITSATFEIRFSGISLFGLGIDGEVPDSLGLDGYVGDGVADVSDYQIADGNQLDSVVPVDPQVGDVLRFSITPYVTELVDAGTTYLGLTVRAESFGGHQFWESSSYPYPKLTIMTGVPEPGTVGLCLLGGLALLRRRRA